MGVDTANWLGYTNVQCLPWSVKKQQEALDQIDIGLMPLKNGPWERGKCSDKALLYNGSGLPALVSPGGMNKEVIVDGENGFFVEDQWEKAILDVHAMTAEKYQGMSKKAIEIVEKRYSYSRVFSTIFSSMGF